MAHTTLNTRRDTFDNMKVKYRLRIPLILILLAGVTLGAGAIAIRNPDYGYSLDLPIGWTDAGSADASHVGFLSPNANAMLQVIAMDPETGASGEELVQILLAELSTQGEIAPFTYLGLSAALTDVEFVTGGNPVRGYIVAIDGFQADFVLLAFAFPESYEAAHDHLLSAVDSFAIDDQARLLPGPISEFFYPLSASEGVPVVTDTQAVEAAGVLVDREARILGPYGTLDRETFEAAWRRFFRMIYRDEYARLEPVAASILAQMQEDGIPQVDYPAEILAWLQSFSYERTGGLSDFRPPVSCLGALSGDCDSLALTYAILLHHMEIDAILMVSDRHGHAMAAVDTFGPGARFPFEERQWLVAEMTAQVPIGQIAADMADPAGWIGVRLRLQLLEQ